VLSITENVCPTSAAFFGFMGTAAALASTRSHTRHTSFYCKPTASTKKQGPQLQQG
jgi:hypothetical protein